jgi:hypothetical protein
VDTVVTFDVNLIPLLIMGAVVTVIAVALLRRR